MNKEYDECSGQDKSGSSLHIISMHPGKTEIFGSYTSKMRLMLVCVCVKCSVRVFILCVFLCVYKWHSFFFFLYDNSR